MSNKISPATINKLVLKGRLLPILETKDGKTYIHGYRRKNGSRKSNENVMFTQPQELKELSKPAATVTDTPTVQLFD
jgi:hypothetical protein